MLLYGAEAWTLSSNDAAALAVFERKVLLKIFGTVRVGDDYCIRTNRKLYELFIDMDVSKRINIQRCRWLSLVVRMDEDAPARLVFDAVIGGNQRVGRPRTRLKDQLEEALTSLGVEN